MTQSTKYSLGAALLVVSVAGLIMYALSRRQPPMNAATKIVDPNQRSSDDWVFIQDIADSDWEHPESLTGVKKLWAEQLLTDADCGLVAKLPNLESLQATDSSITDDGIIALASSRSLSSLSVARTSITDRAAAILGKSMSLRRLGIRGCKVTEEGVLAALQCKRLQEIDIVDIPVSDKTACALRDIHLRTLKLDIKHLTLTGIQCLATLTTLEGNRSRGSGGVGVSGSGFWQ